MIIYTLDRFEGEYAILIDNNANTIDVLRKYVPENAKEGDKLYFLNARFVIDNELTAKSAEAVRSRFDRLKKKHS